MASTGKKGSEETSLELLLFPFRILFQLLYPSQEALGDSLPKEQSLPAVSTLPTIFLFSLLREPLLCKFLIFIFVPLSAEVQVLSLRKKQSILTLPYSLISSKGRMRKDTELFAL